jgi:hypothetical protein
MRLASNRNVLSVFGFIALSAVLAGCPDKSAPGEKTTAEPERAEPDDEGKAIEAKKPAAAASVAPADPKKPDDDKDKGGW